MSDRSTRAERRARAAASQPCCSRPKRLGARATAGHLELFKALGDPTRLEVVGLLAAHGRELCVCDIEGRFELSQPTVSHHLRILREAGIVFAERRGTWVYYTLNPEVRDQLRSFADLLQR